MKTPGVKGEDLSKWNTPLSWDFIDAWIEFAHEQDDSLSVTSHTS